jgi:hypothetical protein
MDSDRNHKQDYLRKSVILKGYRQQAFENFIRGKKPDGMDVDNWTFQEIEALVTEFKASHEPTEEITELMATTDTFEMYSDLNVQDLALEEENKGAELKFSPADFDHKNLMDMTIPEVDNLDKHGLHGQQTDSKIHAKRTYTGAGLDDKDDDGMIADLLNRIEDYKSETFQNEPRAANTKEDENDDFSVIEEAAADKDRLESKLVSSF